MTTDNGIRRMSRDMENRIKTYNKQRVLHSHYIGPSLILLKRQDSA